MTESELCGSSFDWEGSSPSVFLRPMNPALSAQHFFPEDSPVVLDEKENWRRGGVYMTPASPLFGSLSYMSQESSCCSVLNNAVIMDEDDNETIPTDERPNLVPLAVDDVSPIVEKSFNVSDLPVANVSNTTSIVPQSAEDRSNSSLQDFLAVNNPPPAVDMAFIGNSPGPQWSPGIKSTGATFKSPNPSLIRIENFLDASPAFSPVEKKDSSLSLSAIRVETDEVVEEPPLHTTNHKDLSASRAVQEPSPVRHFTHRRTSPIQSENRSLRMERVDEALKAASRLYLDESRLYQRPASPSMHASIYRPRQPLSAKRTVLSSEERSLREAEEGRRRLIDQIHMNRRNFEYLRDRSNISNVSRMDRSVLAPRVELHATRLYPSTYITRPAVTRPSVGSVISSSRSGRPCSLSRPAWR